MCTINFNDRLIKLDQYNQYIDGTIPHIQL